MTTYVFDIDGTLCSNSFGNYYLAEPFSERIAQVNKLFFEGHKIFLLTARGMGSSNNEVDLACR